MLALLVAALLTTITATAADARLPRAKHYRVGGHISMDTNLLSRSGASAWAIDEYLAAHTSLPALGSAFLAAERKYGINARFLLAAALHESGWGTGYIARVKRNLFGYNAYDRDPVRYATAFATYRASIDRTAKFMKEAYLTPGGRWWGGRPTLRSMQQYWSSSGLWGTNVSRVANSIHLDTLRKRGLRFGTPSVSGVIHGRDRVRIRIEWSGGALPAGVGFVATWVPIELDADVVAAAAASTAVADDPVAGPVTALAAPAATHAGSAVAAPPRVRPASARAVAVSGRRVGSSSRATTILAGVPAQPGRYQLHLGLRDVAGGQLPAVDRVTIAATEVRVWADRAVSYAITASHDGTGAVVRVTNTGRRTIPATPDAAAPTSNNPEIQPPRSVITVAASAGEPGSPSFELRAVPLAADLPPGASVTVNVPGLQAATGRSRSWVTATLSVLDDPASLGATASAGAWVTAAAAAPSTPAHTPAPAPVPAPTPKPSPAPVPAKPAPRPKPAAKPRHVTTTLGERSRAITYRGRWAGASSGGYLGGGVAWSGSAGASATLAFTGTSVTWIGPVGPTRGAATIVLDGRVVGSVSLWRSSFDPRAVLYRRSFANPGRHTLRIVVRSTGLVAIDAFIVRS